MNNADLDKMLKSAKGPALDAGYQEDFARGVLKNLTSSQRCYPRTRQTLRPRLAWTFATVACIVLAFAAGHWHGRKMTEQDILADTKLIQETLAMFPNRVKAIVKDEHGMNLILSDTADVPASPPIYVQICDGKSCSSMVTFSGQEIKIAGQQLTVLSEAGGGIILEGNHFIWSTAGRTGGPQGLEIQAKNLQLTAL